MAIAGGCLCDSVRYECASESGGGHCQCVDCRKTSGTGHGSHMMVAADDFSLTGDVTFFGKETDAGNMVQRGFCGTCGSPIYSTNSAFPGMAFVRASSLDDPEHFKPQMRVYTARAASWDHMDAELPAFPEMMPIS